MAVRFATSPLPRCLLSKELVVYLTVLAALLPCVALTYDQQCPTILVDGNTCKCKTGFFHGVVKCGEEDIPTLQRGFWIGKLNNNSNNNNNNNNNGNEYVVGYTPYTRYGNYQFSKLNVSADNESELNELVCGPLNRKGILCGSCKEEFTAPMYSMSLRKCIKCHPNKYYGWILPFLLHTVPITLFFVVVVIFNISATTGGMNFFVFFAQVITATFSIDAGGDVPIGSKPRQSPFVSIYYAVYSIWQLDLYFPGPCYHNPLSTPNILLLLYIKAMYPLLLIAVFLIIVKLHDHGVRPFYGVGKWVYSKIRRFRQPWTVERTVIHALATFLVLSFTKITAVSFMIITPVNLMDRRGKTVRWVPVYYGDSTYSDSLPYILVALLFLMTMVIFPTLLLLALPARTHLGKLIFGKIFKILRINQDGGRLEMFLQTFQGSFKDGSGSDNEINCQTFAGLYLLLRFIIFLLVTFLPSEDNIYLLGQQILCTVAIVMFAIFRPYRKNIHNYLDILGFSLLATINAITFYHSYNVVQGSKFPPSLFYIQYILVFIPLAILILVISRTILRSFCGKCYGNSRLTRQLRKLTTTDEDFVQFVRAVSIRERESRYIYK